MRCTCRPGSFLLFASCCGKTKHCCRFSERWVIVLLVVLVHC
ncbi:DUF2650 domain-containing protein [Escherichia coli]